MISPDSPFLEPALTPEEWAAVIANPPSPAAWDYATGELGGVSTHGLAALALHGQAFGFWPEMVTALRRVAELHEDDYRQQSGEEKSLLAETVRKAADRIEALLPPAP